VGHDAQRTVRAEALQEIGGAGGRGAVHPLSRPGDGDGFRQHRIRAFGSFASALATPQARLTAVGAGVGDAVRVDLDLFWIGRVVVRGQRNAEGARYAQRGRATHGQRVDRVHQLVHGRQPHEMVLPLGKSRWSSVDHRTVHPVERRLTSTMNPA